MFNIQKISGVIKITPPSGQPKMYFGVTGTVQRPVGDWISFTVNDDSYQVLYSDFQVNAQTPSTVSEAITLLNSIFGS